MISYWNVRGIKFRGFEVNKYAQRHDIILLQEPLLKPHDDYEPPGFIVLRRDERRGTLVAICDRPGLSFSSIDCSNFSTDDRDAQGVSVSDERMTRDPNIFNLYVSKASAEQNWDFLHQIQSSGHICTVAGDYNHQRPIPGLVQ